MGYLWLPATIFALISVALAILLGYYKYGAQLGMVALILVAIAFGWYIHGGLTNHQAMNYYYSGEANGYNRGFQDGKTIVTSKSDNTSITYDILPNMYDFSNFD